MEKPPTSVFGFYWKGWFMIKGVISLTVIFVSASCAMSQTTQVQPGQAHPGNYHNEPNQSAPYNSSQPGTYNNSQPATNNANETTSGGVLFTNRAGQTFSAQQLATQLQNLRSAVDQTVPILSAFNESYSNANNGGHQTVGSALSGIVTDVLHRNQNSTQTSTSQTSSNLFGILHGLLNNNTSNSTSPTTPNPQDLVSLQNDLQPVIAALQRLNVNSVSNRTTSPNPNGGLTPTGR